jgi:hypothetical protein
VAAQALHDNGGTASERPTGRTVVLTMAGRWLQLVEAAPRGSEIILRRSLLPRPIRGLMLSQSLRRKAQRRFAYRLHGD